MNRLLKKSLHVENLESRVLMAADVPGPVLACVFEPAVGPGDVAPAVADPQIVRHADELTPEDSRQLVPFKGTFEVSISSFIPIDESHARVVFAVEARGTHLGRATGEAETIFNLAELTYEGTYRWIAANGDEIIGTLTGTLTPTATEALFDNDETFTVEDGTGRFENATGSGSGGGQINLATGLGEVPFEGTISSPGANKHGLP